MGTVTPTIFSDLRQQLREARSNGDKNEAARLKSTIESFLAIQSITNQIAVDVGQIYGKISNIQPPAGYDISSDDPPTWTGPDTSQIKNADVATIVNYLASSLRYLECIQPSGSNWNHSDPAHGDAHEMIYHYVRRIRGQFARKFGINPPNSSKPPKVTEPDHKAFEIEIDIIFHQVAQILKKEQAGSPLSPPPDKADDDSAMEAYASLIYKLFP